MSINQLLLKYKFSFVAAPGLLFMFSHRVFSWAHTKPSHDSTTASQQLTQDCANMFISELAELSLAIWLYHQNQRITDFTVPMQILQGGIVQAERATLGCFMHISTPPTRHPAKRRLLPHRAVPPTTRVVRDALSSARCSYLLHYQQTAINVTAPQSNPPAGGFSHVMTAVPVMAEKGHHTVWLPRCHMTCTSEGGQNTEALADVLFFCPLVIKWGRQQRKVTQQKGN